MAGAGEDGNGWKICLKQQLSPAQCLEFSVPGTVKTSLARDIDGFVVNWQDTFFAYQNSCPHTGASLNWTPNQFFDLDLRFLQCGMHGALFEPDSGLCVRGPCLAQSLRQLPLSEIDGWLCLELDKCRKI